MVMGPDPSAQIAADASSAKKLGIAAIVVSLPCCCPLIGIVLGVLAMNKGKGALQMIAQTGMGQQFAGDANTGKTCGTAAIVIGAIGILINIAATIFQMSQQS